MKDNFGKEYSSEFSCSKFYREWNIHFLRSFLNMQDPLIHELQE
jgi:hypothetical protein